MLPYIIFCVFTVIEITVIYQTDNFALMIKFDFTSHFIIVLCLLFNGNFTVSTLIIMNSSVNSKWAWGHLCNLSKGLQSKCYATEQSV